MALERLRELCLLNGIELKDEHLEKFEKYNIQTSIYVVGSEQTTYFKQIFKQETKKNTTE